MKRLKTVLNMKRNLAGLTRNEKLIGVLYYPAIILMWHAQEYRRCRRQKWDRVSSVLIAANRAFKSWAASLKRRLN